jgi:hypothetical protein
VHDDQRTVGDRSARRPRRTLGRVIVDAMTDIPRGY